MDSFTVNLVGVRGVGRSSLAQQLSVNFIDDNFGIPEACLLTIVVVDTLPCLLYLYVLAEDYFDNDRPGMSIHLKEFHRKSIEKGNGFLLVYSVTSRATFERLEYFHQRIVHTKGNIPRIIFVGNKSDRNFSREVSKVGGEQLAAQFGSSFIETSAKTAQNVDAAFADLVRDFRAQKRDEERNVVDRKAERKKRCIIL
ncbi:P-loop containing nucleoside triphosphate hydrolase protein [Mycena albidolilacea]|uniref:P-loop containing nucleoside triphosphate hydrolase protein n=1 Tax=Mycena albidolilacea TaxID=1033008 RepID=A0AAD7ACV0_9AGAR|nr:P-loop containing nucleoside triphosphate hydrolase protein [Mycena albidolilacea]